MPLFDQISGMKCIFVLDKKYDYFDIVPSLELHFRKRFKIYKKQLILIDTYDTQARFMASGAYEKYKEKINELHESIRTLNKVSYDYESRKDYEEKIDTMRKNIIEAQKLKIGDDLPISLMSEETILIEGVSEFLGGRVAERYWRVVIDDIC